MKLESLLKVNLAPKLAAKLSFEADIEYKLRSTKNEGNLMKRFSSHSDPNLSRSKSDIFIKGTNMTGQDNGQFLSSTKFYLGTKNEIY